MQEESKIRWCHPGLLAACRPGSPHSGYLVWSWLDPGPGVSPLVNHIGPSIDALPSGQSPKNSCIRLCAAAAPHIALTAAIVSLLTWRETQRIKNHYTSQVINSGRFIISSGSGWDLWQWGCMRCFFMVNVWREGWSWCHWFRETIRKQSKQTYFRHIREGRLEGNTGLTWAACFSTTFYN